MNTIPYDRLSQQVARAIRVLLAGETAIADNADMFPAMTVSDVMRGLARMPGKLGAIPLEHAQVTDVYETENPRVFGFEKRLWYNGGESDLEIIGEVTLGETPDLDVVVIDDLRVM